MMIRRRKRETPALNTTSTADISFMLLVFFLLTSSMNSDKGLTRRLPPPDQPQQQTKDINRSDVLQLRLDANDQLWVDDQQVTTDEAGRQVESFVASRQTERYVVAVETDRHTSYDAYFTLQNTIVAAFRHLRDRMAEKRYGHPFAQCNEEERQQIVNRYPLRISEVRATMGEEGGQP